MTGPFKDNFYLQALQGIALKRRVPIYLVGGVLRDYLLGIKTFKDFDFTLPKGALKIACLFAKEIKGAFVILDKERGCARVVKKDKGEVLTFDFADFRAKTLKEDLTHRDFTINSLCLPLSDFMSPQRIEDLILDLKKGIKDIRSRVIRMVSRKSFKEDPLRLLRAFSLKAVFNLTIETKTSKQIQKDLDRVREVSYERIREELFKILETEKTADHLKAMDKIHFLERIIPQIRIMFRCTQGGYHHLDVWPHSLETVSRLDKLVKELQGDEDLADYLRQEIGGNHSRKSILKLAALLHDIGKPQTKKNEQGKTSFHGHERVGKAIVRGIAKMLKISTQERFVLENMVFWHLRPGYLSNFEKPSQRSIYRYLRDTKEEAPSILLLSLADQRATRGPLTTQRDQRHHEKICLDLMKYYFEQKKQLPFIRLIDGDDLIKGLKLTPSPLFGKILREVEEKQNLGKVKTKEEALALAKSMVRKKGDSYVR